MSGQLAVYTVYNTGSTDCSIRISRFVQSTPKGEDKWSKMHGKVANKSTLQDHQVDEQSSEEEATTRIRDDKTNVPPIGDGW